MSIKNFLALLAVTGSFLLIPTVFVRAEGYVFTVQTQAPNLQFTSIASSDDGMKIAAVGVTSIYTSSDGGSTWVQRTDPTSSPWKSVASSANGTKLIVVSNNGNIFTSTNSGMSWTQRTGAGNHAWISVASSADGTKLVVVSEDLSDGGNDGGDPGRIYTSNDSGATWTQRTGAGLQNWTSVASSADGTKLLAGTIKYGECVSCAQAFSGYVYISINSGATWSEINPTDNPDFEGGTWSSVAMSDTGTTMYVTSPDNGIYKSVDSGSTWESLDEYFSDEGDKPLAISVSGDGTKIVGFFPSYKTFYSYNGGSSSKEIYKSCTSANMSKNGLLIQASCDNMKFSIGQYSEYAIPRVRSLFQNGAEQTADQWSPIVDWDGADRCLYYFDNPDSDSAEADCSLGGSDIPLPQFDNETLFGPNTLHVIYSVLNDNIYNETTFSFDLLVGPIIINSLGLQNGNGDIYQWNPSINWKNYQICYYAFSSQPTIVDSAQYQVDCSENGSDIPPPTDPSIHYLIIHNGYYGDDENSVFSQYFNYVSGEVSIASLGQEDGDGNILTWSPSIDWRTADYCTYKFNDGPEMSVNCGDNGSDIPAPDYNGPITLRINAADNNNGITYPEVTQQFAFKGGQDLLTINGVGENGNGEVSETTWSPDIQWGDAGECLYGIDNNAGELSANCGSSGSDIPFPTGLDEGVHFIFFIGFIYDENSNLLYTDTKTYSFTYTTGGSPSDITAPIITGVSANSISTIGTTITWTTNEPATSKVVYGLTSSYESSTVLDVATTTSHSVSLSGLSPAITYHFAVVSRDNAGNTATSTDQTFTTIPISSGGSSGGGSSSGSYTSGSGGSSYVPTQIIAPVATSTSTTTLIVEPQGCNAGALFNTITGTRCSLQTQSPLIPTTQLIPITAFVRPLTLGSRGADVMILQNALIAKGLLAVDSNTGYFGSATKAALIKFQIASSVVPASGFFGTVTQAIMTTGAIVNSQPNAMPAVKFTQDMTIGTNSAQVKMLQQYLNSQGYKIAFSGNGAPGNESTYFGPATKAALIKFQNANGIIPATGFFGALTRAFISNLQ